MSKSSILLELQYLPPIQYVSKFYGFQEVVIEQHENYNKRSFRNRCHIAGVNGMQRLTIPLKSGKNERQSIREVRIAYDEPWQRQHWTSICSAYGNAPFFDFYIDGLEVFYEKEWTFLFDYNWQILAWLVQQLDVPANIVFTDQYDHRLTGSTDGRNLIKPNVNIQDPFFASKYYPQVFIEKNGFLANLSILDLLFCSGPQASLILEQSFTTTEAK